MRSDKSHDLLLSVHTASLSQFGLIRSLRAQSIRSEERTREHMSQPPADVVEDLALADSQGGRPKRRRYSRKQTPRRREAVGAVPAGAQPAIAPAELGAGEPMAVVVAADDVAPAVPEEIPQRPADLTKADYSRFHYRFRIWWKRRQGQNAADADDANLFPLRSMSSVQKCETIELWAAEDEQADPQLREKFLAFYRYHKRRGTGWAFNGKSCLLTYNGPWGLFSAHEFGPELPSLESFCQKLKVHPRVIRLRDDVHKAILDWIPQFHIKDAAYSVEVSLESFRHAVGMPREEPDQLGMRIRAPADNAGPPAPDADSAPAVPTIRLHVHISLRNNNKFRIRTLEHLAFQGTVPVLSQQSIDGNSRRRGVSSCAFYYVQCPKKSMVSFGGTMLPFSDYMVDPNWPLNLLQQGKIGLADCRKEVVRTGKNLPRFLQCLDMVRDDQNAKAIAARVSEALDFLDRSSRPFRVIPAVEAWKQSFQELRPRYPFPSIRRAQLYRQDHVCAQPRLIEGVCPRSGLFGLFLPGLAGF